MKIVSLPFTTYFGFILADANMTLASFLTDKELIDQHTKDIEELKNQPPVELPEIKGDGLDMGELMKLFAAKTPPDNTIKRIENLESMVTDLNDKLKNFNPVAAPTELPFDANDLIQRVQSLEKRAGEADRRFDKDEEVLADHERRIKALESMDMTPSAAPTGEIDTASILKQVNLLRAETSSMRSDFNDYKQKVIGDLEALRHEMRNYTDKEVNELS